MTRFILVPSSACKRSSEASANPSVHLLFAGGCHVNGYPVGEASSFSEITASSLGCTPTRIAPVGLTKTSRLVDYLRLHRRPDVAILQFGNYEVPRPLAKHERSVFTNFGGSRAARFSGSSSKKPWLCLPPGYVFEPNLSWRSRVLVKQLYANIAQHLDPPLFDADAVRFGLRALLAQIAPFNIPTTVVLTPLPCADHMARRFRIAAAPIFHEEAAAAGLLSLDTAGVLGYGSRRAKRSFDIYADERHLNLRGHQLLADALIRLLEPHLSVANTLDRETMYA